MALRLVGSALVCAQLWTICLSAGPDTVAWNLMSVKHPDEVWHLERVEFLKRAPGGNEETVRWRSACHTGCDDSTRRAAGRINWNAKAVNVNRPPDRVFCLRYEFDTSTEDGLVPFDTIRVEQKHGGSLAARHVRVSFEYKQLEHALYEKLEVDSDGRTDIPIKAKDVLKAVAHQLDANLTGELYETARRNRQQAEQIAALTNQLAAVERDDAVLRASIARHTLELENLCHNNAVAHSACQSTSPSADARCQPSLIDRLDNATSANRRAIQQLRQTVQRQKTALSLGTAGVLAVAAGALRARIHRKPAADAQITKVVPSRSVVMTGVAALAAGFGLHALYSSSARPPARPKFTSLTRPLPRQRLYVPPEYRWPVIAGAVTIALVVLAMAVLVVCVLRTRHRPSEPRFFRVM
ncbi:L-type lectin-like domain-containing protein [Plasmodiophora brassicae]|uniref:L-type lectin-like domain-containing protein n=1 Tax=Plasmodiophora brassicae TaxID=37360 RepID=A0A0G4IR27_PLABS|nr:hypothetical protein PBRA_005947 [Plasmodiophora brassicae]SPQ98383.1 unnamed protein product [Plasmodiophora brassicae]